ncbi:MAG: precorrin-2/cobalt-factor-2 C20-methyltransferase [Kiritimatiellia bacterium]|jgi:precorrin-2/cobalt-factor-2 C20-methyltransferase
MTATTIATFIGVGVGPGDPELITLKAARIIQQADVISYLANEQGQSQAKTIASLVLDGIDKPQDEIAVYMPMSDDRSMANKIYDQAAADIQQAMAAGKTVVFLCEGDPLFFGSFAYLLERLQAAALPCEVVPGISSVHAAASALKMPLTLLKESFAVMSGRHSDQQLIAALQTHDSVVIMKAGRSRQKILDALTVTKRLHEAKYLEYIGREEQLIEYDATTLKGEAGPYFSLFVITKHARDRT